MKFQTQFADSDFLYKIQPHPIKATAARLDRSYKNGPKSASSIKDGTGICHLCLAGRPRYDYEDLHPGVHILFRNFYCMLSLHAILNKRASLTKVSPDPFLRSDEPAFKATCGTQLPWTNEAIFTRVLMHELSAKESFHKIDVFHTVNMGVGKSFAASSIVVLLHHCAGSSVDAKLSEMTGFFLEFCKEAGVNFNSSKHVCFKKSENEL